MDCFEFINDVTSWCVNSARRVFGVHLKPIQAVVYSYLYIFRAINAEEVGYIYFFTE